MWVKFGVILGLCWVLAACSAQSGLTGSYIGGDDSARMMVQISSIKDHEINGNITAVLVSDSGKVTALTRHLSGTINSKLVNLNVENGAGLSLLTGTLDDKGLSLTIFAGEKSQKLLFERRDPNEFAALTEGVRRRAAAIQQASVERQANAARMGRLSTDQEQITNFAQEMATKADSLAEGVVQIDQITASFRDASVRAARLGDVSARLVAHPAEAYGQIQQVDFEKEQNADGARSSHESALEALRFLNEASRQYEARVETLTALCNSSPELDCRGLAASVNMYRARAATLRTAIGHENTAYEAVRSKL